jgi:hypothetical protein
MDSYLFDKTTTEKESLTLDIFLKDNKADNFIILSKEIPIEEAQTKLQKCKKCKDIFITINGKKDEKMIGWIPNIHLLEYLTI